MATTKLTINNNGSVKIEGDFEIVDRNGNVYGLAGRDMVCAVAVYQKTNLFVTARIMEIFNMKPLHSNYHQKNSADNSHNFKK
jgi:hypothetical protein